MNTLKELPVLAYRYIVLNGSFDGQALQDQQAVSKINNNRFIPANKMVPAISSRGYFDNKNFKLAMVE